MITISSAIVRKHLGDSVSLSITAYSLSSAVYPLKYRMALRIDDERTAIVEPAPAIPGAQRTLTIGLLLIITLVAFEALAVATVLPIVEDQLGELRLYGCAFSGFLLGIVWAGAQSGSCSNSAGRESRLRGTSKSRSYENGRISVVNSANALSLYFCDARFNPMVVFDIGFACRNLMDVRYEL